LTSRGGFRNFLMLRLDMSCSRQRKLNPALRACAATMVLVWLAATGFCSLDSQFGHGESGGGQHVERDAHHEDEAVPSSAESGHSHDSDKNSGDEHSCCISLKATPQFASSTLLTKPDFGKPLSFGFLSLTQTRTFVEREAPCSRQPPERKWVFTLEVCLGPAFRSHAPPLLS